MKKSLLLFLLALIGSTFSLFAQTATPTTTPDLTTKRGEVILPQAGDWAISVDADPFLNYLGNFFGKSANNTAPTFMFPNTNFMVQGKYFTDATTAYRAGIRIGLHTGDTTTEVANRAVTTAPVFPALPAMVSNEWKISSTNISLTAGMEKHIGHSRLGAYYGAEAAIGLSSSSNKFTYGNALSTSATAPVNVSEADAFNGANNLTDDTYGNPARVTEIKSGTTFEFGIRGFVGVQYFILPKLSIGGEFGWGLGIATTGQSSYTTESIGSNGTSQVVGDQTIDGGKKSSIGVDTDNKYGIFGQAGDLLITFYFQ